MATATVVGATASLLFLDVARTDQQRIDDLHRDLATATVSIGQDTLEPQLALNEFASDMDTILAAINGKQAYFSVGFEQLRQLFPDARALHVATSPGHAVTTVGDPLVRGAFERARTSSFCTAGKAYAVVASAIGRRGWVALALDPERSLGRARAGAAQPVSVALVEAGAADVLADSSGAACRPFAEPEDRLAAQGEYSVSLLARQGGAAGIGFSPILGTSLSIVLEDDATHHEVATATRRAALLALGAVVWGIGYLAWRLRSGVRRGA